MRKKTSKILIVLGLLSGSLIYLNAEEEEKYTLENLGFSFTTATEFLKDSEKAIKAIHMANAYTRHDNIPDSYYDYIDEMAENGVSTTDKAYKITKLAFKLIRTTDLEYFISKFNQRKYLFNFAADKGDAQLKAFNQDYSLLVEQLYMGLLDTNVPEGDLEAAKEKFAQLNWRNENMDFQLIKEAIQAQLQIVKDYQTKYNEISNTIQLSYCPDSDSETSALSDLCDFSFKKEL